MLVHHQCESFGGSSTHVHAHMLILAAHLAANSGVRSAYCRTDVIFVDGREPRSSQVRRVRIPINIEITKRDRLSLLAVAAGLSLG